MINITEDPKMGQLLQFCRDQGISINLQVSSLDEMGRLSHAHKLHGAKNVEIMNFLTHAILPNPKIITAEFIFKAWKFNHNFRNRYALMFEMGSSFRERAYRQARKMAKAKAANEDTNPKYQPSESIVRDIKSGKNEGRCPMPIGDKTKSASDEDNELSLPEPCSLPNKEWEYKEGTVYRNNDDKDEIEITINIPNVQEFIDSKKKLCIIIFNEDNSTNNNQANYKKLEKINWFEECGYLQISAESKSGVIKDGSKWDILLLEGDSE